MVTRDTIADTFRLVEDLARFQESAAYKSAVARLAMLLAAFKVARRMSRKEAR